MNNLETLLAVDAGLSCGFALYGNDGRLIWYRSHHYGSLGQLKKAAHTLLRSVENLSVIVIEGGGPLAEVWLKEGERKKIRVIQTWAEKWRKSLLYSRDQRSGTQAKGRADSLARQVIEWSGAKNPTALRHDTAEAILIGLWAAERVGWLKNSPWTKR